MKAELRLHGYIDNDIEYFATAAGCRAAHHHFYQLSEKELRLFSPGNELVIDNSGVRQSGNGGIFCEYMFGVEQPLADLTKQGILNRLVLLGVSYNSSGKLQLSENQLSKIDFEQLFIKGHAVYNYFFFIDGLQAVDSQHEQQKILFNLGKALKRIQQLNQRDDSMLTDELLAALPKECMIFLVRLINTRNRLYQEEFQQLYYRHRSIPKQEFQALQTRANELDISPYQQERIRIDIMYHHRDNYRIIDEYKRVLIDCHQSGNIDRQQHARLTRLKTLSVRNKIPPALFQTLDEQLKTEPETSAAEPEYIAISRQILQGLFIGSQTPDAGIDSQDMIQLLLAKRQAHNNRDHSFEQLLLETGKLCDEQIRDGAPMSLLENFSNIITFFDRFNTVSSHISQLAFMDSFRITESLLRSLLGSQQAFNELEPDLFNRLFFEEILGNSYLGRYGRRKLLCLLHGLKEISADRATLRELGYQITELDAEERLFQMVLKSTKERIRNQYSRYNTYTEQKKLFSELNDELLVRGIISDQLDSKIFQSVVHDIKKEAAYLHNLLPEIISGNDRELREEFLTNSGLDRFYVEELEREYFTLNHIDLDQLQLLRTGSDN